jgi:Type IV pilin-like G and H, putative
MKTLLRSTLVLCLSISFGTPLRAEAQPNPSVLQPSLAGTWSSTVFGDDAIVIFDKAGNVNLLSKKIQGDYKYYQFPDAEYYGLMQQVASGKFVVEPSPKYKVQGNMVEVAVFNGNVTKLRLDFTDNGRIVNFIEENQPKPSFSFKRISEDSELPKETESLATLEGHFHGLRKLMVLQVAQADLWTQKRRFAKELQTLKIKPLPESDRSYRYELVKQGQRQSIIAAIATQPNLRSFVLQLDRVGLRQQPFNGIICATDRPSDQMPLLPLLKNKGLVCATKTHQVDFNPQIRRSLLKVK